MYDVALLTEENPSKLTELFGKHLISILISGTGSDLKRQSYAYSGFLVLIGDDWVVMTAGHSVEGIKKATSQGFKVDVFDLIDSFSSGTHKRSLPIGCVLEDWHSSYSHDNPGGMDIAFKKLDPFHQRALKANNMSPINLAEDFSRLKKSPVEMLMLAGLPDEKTNIGNAAARLTVVIIPGDLIAFSQASEVFKDGSENRYFGQLDRGKWNKSDLTSITGTSGGPVFGIWYSEDKKQFDYTVVAIDPAWQ